MRLVAEPGNQVYPTSWGLTRGERMFLAVLESCKPHLHTHLERPANLLTRDDGRGKRKAYKCGAWFLGCGRRLPKEMRIPCYISFAPLCRVTILTLTPS